MKRYIISLSIMICIVYSFLFIYICSFSSKDLYTYQVGVYKNEQNCNEKLEWLNKNGIKGYCYRKDNLYYVVSLISDDYDDIHHHSQSIKGIIKKYKVIDSLSHEEFIKSLKE